MERQIEKLISEYSMKEEEQRTLISGYRRTISKGRKSGDDCPDARKEQACCFAKLNAYTQAKSDLDSLLDYI